MSIYLAVVKYATDSDDHVKLNALRDGLREIAWLLHDEHGWDCGRILDEFEEAALDVPSDEEAGRS